MPCRPRRLFPSDEQPIAEVLKRGRRDSQRLPDGLPDRRVPEGEAYGPAPCPQEPAPADPRKTALDLGAGIDLTGPYGPLLQPRQLPKRLPCLKGQEIRADRVPDLSEHVRRRLLHPEGLVQSHVAARLRYPHEFPDRPLLVGHECEHRLTDDNIEPAIVERQLLDVGRVELDPVLDALFPRP